MTLIEKIVSAVALSLALSFVGYSSFSYVKKLGYNEAVSIYEKQKEADKKITDAATKQLQAKADQAAKDKEDAIKVADAKYADLLNSVSKRTTRLHKQDQVQLPQLQAPAQEPNFTERMQNFLQGKLPEQTK